MKKYIAEFIGTFSLVLFGCGAAVISGVDQGELDGLGILGISFAFGLAVVAMAYAIGPISGCHINPAISIAMLAVGKLSVKDALGHIVAQIVGAIAAAGLLYIIVSGQHGFTGLQEWGLGSNGWGEGYLGNFSTIAAFITEFTPASEDSSTVELEEQVMGRTLFLDREKQSSAHYLFF